MALFCNFLLQPFEVSLYYLIRCSRDPGEAQLFLSETQFLTIYKMKKLLWPMKSNWVYILCFAFHLCAFEAQTLSIVEREKT